jgi:hypothetical protein
MASKHRERKVIATVACPTCGAPPGMACRQTISGRPQLFSGRPIVHQSRREAWQAAKGGPNVPSPPEVPQ